MIRFLRLLCGWHSRFSAVAAVLALALAACGSSPTSYRSVHPNRTQADFDRDTYECRRENTHTTLTTIFGRPVAGPEVDEDMAAACMRVRGWQATTAASGDPPKMDWPLRGRIISAFGSTNNGIDIAAAKGTPVKAADAGTVIYAGAEAPRFGNLLLVNHAGGYVTAYAHNDVLLVKKGDAVSRGQTIARVGNSGGAPEPKLHFEVRSGNRPIDPMRVLPP